MQVVLQQYTSTYPATLIKIPAWVRFIAWCKIQDEYRIVWLAMILVSHGTLFTPLTLFVIMSTGNSMLALVFAIAAMGMSLITNLAALSTRITIPTYFLSILVDFGIVIACLISWF